MSRVQAFLLVLTIPLVPTNRHMTSLLTMNAATLWKFTLTQWQHRNKRTYLHNVVCFSSLSFRNDLYIEGKRKEWQKMSKTNGLSFLFRSGLGGKGLLSVRSVVKILKLYGNNHISRNTFRYVYFIFLRNEIHTIQILKSLRSKNMNFGHFSHKTRQYKR